MDRNVDGPSNFAGLDGRQGTHHRGRWLHRLASRRAAPRPRLGGLGARRPFDRVDAEHRSPLRSTTGFHLVVESASSQSSVVSELVYRCDVVYHLAAAVGVRLIVEQPGTHAPHERPRHGERPRVLPPLRQARPRSRRPPRSTATTARRCRSRRRRAGSTGRRPQRGGRTRTPRRWTSSSRSRTTRRGPRLHDRPALQHRRAAAERPVRDGDPAFVQSALAGRAARDPRRRDADAVLLPRARTRCAR